VKKSKEEIGLALEGNWREDLLFEVQSCLFMYDVYNTAISNCDEQMEKMLVKFNAELELANRASSLKNVAKKKSKYSPNFNVRHIAFTYLKTDLFEIPGISHNTVLCLLTNLGNDIRKFKTAKQFASWLRLVPNNKISGGKVMSSRTPKGKNTIAIALRQAANSIGNQKAHELTPFFKRIAYRKGRIAAITATARKLAIIIWNMICKGEAYREFDYERTSKAQRLKQLKAIENRIQKLKLSDDEIKSLSKNISLSNT
jgi:hypothetical protein